MYFPFFQSLALLSGYTPKALLQRVPTLLSFQRTSSTFPSDLFAQDPESILFISSTDGNGQFSTRFLRIVPVALNSLLARSLMRLRDVKK